MNIILIGYRASSKTSAGRELAKILGRPFFKTDRMIFAKTGRTIQEIVDASGWQAFREVKKAVIAELSGLDGVVIALGSNAIMDPDTVAMLGTRGRFVWLRADAEILARRMSRKKEGAGQRPVPSGAETPEKIDSVLAARLPVYGAVAEVIVDTMGKDPAGIAAEIAGCLEDDLMDEEKKKRRPFHVR